MNPTTVMKHQKSGKLGNLPYERPGGVAVLRLGSKNNSLSIARGKEIIREQSGKLILMDLYTNIAFCLLWWLQESPSTIFL